MAHAEVYSDIHPSASALVIKRVTDFKDGYKQNLAILGRRGLGKTTLLRFVEQQTRLDGRVVPVYLSVHGATPTGLLQQMQDGLAWEQEDPARDGCDSSAWSRLCPHTAELARRAALLCRKNRLHDFIRSLMMLPEVYATETKKPVVVMWDDFDEMQRWGGEGIFQEFGRGLMMQKRCLCIVTSSRVGAAHKILSEKLSLLFGHFETLTLEPVGVAAGRRWLADHLKPMGMSHDLTDFLIDFCGGSIWALHGLARVLRHRAAALKVDEIKPPLLTDVVTDLLVDDASPLVLTFQSWLDGILIHLGWEAVALLERLSRGRCDLKKDLSTERSSASRWRRLCDELQGLGFIERNGRWRLLADPLFAFWLNHVWPQRHKPGSVLKEHLNTIVSQAFDAYQRQYHRDWSSQMADLVSCFADDTVTLQGRRYRLSHVEDINVLKWKQAPGATVDVLKIKTNRGVWWVILEADRLKEGDVVRLLQEARRDDPKARRIVLISTSGLDDQVRLKALEDNLWIWQERHLRDLAHLFQRPFIVKGV